jgi:hypothetical protein
MACKLVISGGEGLGQRVGDGEREDRERDLASERFTADSVCSSRPGGESVTACRYVTALASPSAHSAASRRVSPTRPLGPPGQAQQRRPAATPTVAAQAQSALLATAAAASKRRSARFPPGRYSVTTATGARDAPRNRGMCGCRSRARACRGSHRRSRAPPSHRDPRIQFRSLTICVTLLRHLSSNYRLCL